MSPHLSTILSYTLMLLVYVWFCMSTKKVIATGIYNTHPINMGFFLSTVLFLLIAGMSSIIRGRAIPPIPLLVVGILIFAAALYVFESVFAGLGVVLLISTLIVLLAVVCGIGLRYVFIDLTLNWFLLWLFVAIGMSFFIQQLLGRR